MGILISKKIITPEATPLKCDGKATVELMLNAAGSIQSNPVDIMLVLDQSGSMAGAPLAALKAASKQFIEIIDKATNNGTATGTLSGGSTIGIVKFDATATFVAPPGMTSSVTDLKNVIDGLTHLNGTCHGCALHAARTNFNSASTNKKIIILFTDGENNTFTYNADDEANSAKTAGMEIYCIGLGDINVANLNSWSTDPDNTHVLIAPTPANLTQAFEDLAANINLPGALNIVIEDTIYPDFEIIEGTNRITFGGSPLPTPISIATVSPDKKSIRWTISVLGKSGNESASLKFDIKHVSCTGGNKSVNKTITYLDEEGNTASFSTEDNDVEVKCIEDIETDCCTPPEVVNFNECEEYKEVQLPLNGEAYDLSCVGRLLSVNVKLSKICPNRKIVVGVMVYEVVDNMLVPRGFKVVEVDTPLAGSNEMCICKSFNVGPFEFILPEEISLCQNREFKVKVIAHYSDILSNYKVTC
ncbi:MAG: vWA domain-containing protein [Terrisporobacter sp.]